MLEADEAILVVVALVVRVAETEEVPEVLMEGIPEAPLPVVEGAVDPMAWLAPALLLAGMTEETDDPEPVAEITLVSVLEAVPPTGLRIGELEIEVVDCTPLEDAEFQFGFWIFWILCQLPEWSV